MSVLAARLLKRLESRQARVGVVGRGFVGLPLAVEFASSGLTSTGIDLDARKVAAIQRRESYIPDVPFVPALSGRPWPAATTWSRER